MRILREDTAVLLIDVQERLLPAMSHPEETLAAMVQLVKGMNILDVPILPVRQYPRGLGDLVPELREALGDYTPSDKATFSAWDEKDIAARIQALGKKNLVVFGLESHVCVLQTVIDLLANGYNVALVTDCIDSRKTSDHAIALRRAEEEGALLTTGESILFELLRASGTDTFKQISALVK